MCNRYSYIKLLFFTVTSIPLVANINFTYPPISMDQVQYINIFRVNLVGVDDCRQICCTYFRCLVLQQVLFLTFKRIKTKSANDQVGQTNIQKDPYHSKEKLFTFLCWISLIH